MIFYDKNGNIHNFDLNSDNKIGAGRNAKVYRISNDKCLKVMNKDPNNFFSEDIFEIFKTLSLPSFVKIDTPFYVDGKIKAYTMEYLEQTDKSILDMPIEYTLDNVNNIYLDLLKLSKYLINAFDLYHKNVILDDDKITVIDYDAYYKSKTEYEALSASIWNLMYTFRRLYETELEKRGIDINNVMIGNMSISKYLSRYLFNYGDANHMEEPAKVLERRLVGIKTPMELFRRKW